VGYNPVADIKVYLHSFSRYASRNREITLNFDKI